MKRIITMILAVLMMASLFAACGSEQTDPTESPEASSDVSDAEATDAANIDDADKEFALGVVTATEYTNSFAGLSFKLPANWTFASETELEDMMGAGSDVIFGEDKQAVLEYAEDYTVYDMMAQNPDDGANIIVMFENTAMYDGGAELTEEEYLAALTENLGAMDAMTYKVATTTSKAKIKGVEYTVLEAEIEGYSAYQTYYVRRIGNYMLCICFTGYEANPGSTMQAYFE